VLLPSVGRLSALPLDVEKGATRSQDNFMGYFNDDQIVSVCCDSVPPPLHDPHTITAAPPPPACRFFALPLDVKKGAKRSQDNSMGYFNDEFTKQKMDLKEGFDFRHVQVLAY
jgi:hypothetical protein